MRSPNCRQTETPARETDDMCSFTRREIGRIAIGAAASGSTLYHKVIADNKGDRTVNIQRYAITEAVADIPIISLAAKHENVVYVCGVTADPANLGDVKDQTRQVLGRIDRLLGQAGTDKSKLLSAQVWLTDMALFADHNAVWNAWVDRNNPPVRACVQSPQLWRPGMLVEIMVTAAL